MRDYANQVYPIKEEIRQLILSIWNGDAKIEDVMPAMHYLDCHFPENKLQAALAWLVKNNLRGKRFVEYVQHDCGGSYLELHRRLAATIEKMNFKEKRIIAGVDFK